MDSFTIARDMALGLAAGHWSARINMLGVAYFIGSRPNTPALGYTPMSKADEDAIRRGSFSRMRNICPRKEARKQSSFHRRTTQLWMIGFDKVSAFQNSIGKDKNQVIQQLVSDSRATNGPYYPRVLARNEREWKLWLEFAQTYIRASKTILDSHRQEWLSHGIPPQKSDEIILKSPSRVMNKWMKTAAEEYNVTAEQFIARIKSEGWEMPGRQDQWA